MDFPLSRELVFDNCFVPGSHLLGELNRGFHTLRKLASMAKWFSSDTAMEVTTNAVQFLGGYGYTREFPLERMMRDAKTTQIYAGTNQVQRMIIARELLK